MTPNEYVFSALSESGLPGTFQEWRQGKAPPLPWFVYRRTRGGFIHADNDNYAQLPRYRAELWMPTNDPDTREAFEDAVRSIGPFTSNESWVPSENAYQVEYTFTYHPGSCPGE